jgi:DNA polymerase I
MEIADLKLPNIRRIFIPDDDYILFEADLKGADAQVVAWDSGDELLKDAFRQGLDIHDFNADTMDEPDWRRVKNFDKKDPERKKVRDAYKSAVHGTNYLGTARAIAHHPRVRWDIKRAEAFQKRWFELHPAIKLWHRRIDADLAASRTVRNVFGYHRIYFDRLDQCLTNAVAWIPQSSVAINCFKGALAIRRAIRLGQLDKRVQLLLQVHDSIVGQIPKDSLWLLREIHKLLHVETPYPDPLLIPWDFKIGEANWGDCKDVKWESVPEGARAYKVAHDIAHHGPLNPAL